MNNIVSAQDKNNTEAQDLQKRELDAMCVNESALHHPFYHNIKYIAVGIVFGLVFVKAEIISWFRIQEMFRLQSFHMYGVIGSAVAVGAISVWALKKFNVGTIYNEPIKFSDKKFHPGVVIGGLLFGIGWALTGACPGSLFVQLGTGIFVVIMTILSAILGTWVYGAIRHKLPH